MLFFLTEGVKNFIFANVFAKRLGGFDALSANFGEQLVRQSLQKFWGGKVRGWRKCPQKFVLRPPLLIVYAGDNDYLDEESIELSKRADAGHIDHLQDQGVQDLQSQGVQEHGDLHGGQSTLTVKCSKLKSTTSFWDKKLRYMIS